MLSVRELLGSIFSRASALRARGRRRDRGRARLPDQQLADRADHRALDPARGAARPDRAALRAARARERPRRRAHRGETRRSASAQSLEPTRRGSARCRRTLPGGGRRHQERLPRPRRRLRAAVGALDRRGRLGQEHAARRVRARPARAVRAPRLRQDRHDRVRARERADRHRHERPLPGLRAASRTRASGTSCSRCSRRHRPDCPIESVVFAISIDALLARPAGRARGARARAAPAPERDPRAAARRRARLHRRDQGRPARGLRALARLLPARSSSQQAFGWTNDQRRLPDPEARCSSACAELADRLDGDAARADAARARSRRASARCSCCRRIWSRRRAKLARFARRRVQEGRLQREHAVPARRLLHERARRRRGRLAHARAARRARRAAVRGATASGSLFLRELVLEVIRGDHTLALREPVDRAARPARDPGRGGDRRALVPVGVGHLVLAELPGQRGARATAPARCSRRPPSASQLSALRGAIETQERVGRSPLHYSASESCGARVDAAKLGYATIFEKAIDGPTKARLRTDLAQRGRRRRAGRDRCSRPTSSGCRATRRTRRARRSSRATRRASCAASTSGAPTCRTRAGCRSGCATTWCAASRSSSRWPRGGS